MGMSILHERDKNWSFVIKRMRRVKEQMYPLVASYERGEVSKSSICQEYDLRDGTFWYWVKKYRSEEEGAFIELVDSERIDEDTQMEILLGDGIIRFSQIPAAKYIRQLLIG